MKFYAEYRDKLYEASSPRELEKILSAKIEETEHLEASLERFISFDLDMHYRQHTGLRSWSGTSRNVGSNERGWSITPTTEEHLAGITFSVQVVDVSAPLPDKAAYRLSVIVPHDAITGALQEPTEKPTPDHSRSFEKNLIPFTPERWATIVALRNQLRALYLSLESVFVDPTVLTKALDNGIGALLLPASAPEEPKKKKPKAG